LHCVCRVRYAFAKPSPFEANTTLEIVNKKYKHCALQQVSLSREHSDQLGLSVRKGPRIRAQFDPNEDGNNSGLMPCASVAIGLTTLNIRRRFGFAECGRHRGEADFKPDLCYTALSLDCLCFALPDCKDRENSHA